MEISPTDTWDVTLLRDLVTYRVVFWEKESKPPGAIYGRGASLTAWRITGAHDVHEVLSWAERERNAREFLLYVETVSADGRDVSLLRLAGFDPTDGSDPDPSSLISDDADAERVRDRQQLW